MIAICSVERRRGRGGEGRRRGGGRGVGEAYRTRGETLFSEGTTAPCNVYVLEPNEATAVRRLAALFDCLALDD